MERVGNKIKVMKKHFTKAQFVSIIIFILMIIGTIFEVLYTFMEIGNFTVIIINLFMIQQLILFHVPKK